MSLTRAPLARLAGGGDLQLCHGRLTGSAVLLDLKADFVVLVELVEARALQG